MRGRREQVWASKGAMRQIARERYFGTATRVGFSIVPLRKPSPCYVYMYIFMCIKVLRLTGGECHSVSTAAPSDDDTARTERERGWNCGGALLREEELWWWSPGVYNPLIPSTHQPSYLLFSHRIFMVYTKFSTYTTPERRVYSLTKRQKPLVSIFANIPPSLLLFQLFLKVHPKFGIKKICSLSSTELLILPRVIIASPRAKDSLMD